MTFNAPLELLSRVKITAPYEGVIQTIVAEVTGRRPTQDGGWLYDVLLPRESAPRHDDEYGLRDRRTLPDQEARLLEFVGPPVRIITFPAEAHKPTDHVAGWPQHIGVAA